VVIERRESAHYAYLRRLNLKLAQNDAEECVQK
jgi:hypothetical protein